MPLPLPGIEFSSVSLVLSPFSIYIGINENHYMSDAHNLIGYFSTSTLWQNAMSNGHFDSFFPPVQRSIGLLTVPSIFNECVEVCRETARSECQKNSEVFCGKPFSQGMLKELGKKTDLPIIVNTVLRLLNVLIQNAFGGIPLDEKCLM
jgi:hypothetical protein